MAYEPPTQNLPDNDYALRVFRKSLASRAYKAVDIYFNGDSLTEGYYASAPNKRWVEVFRDNMQTAFNPAGVPGGEGYVPACFSLGGTTGTPAAPIGSINLPMRWSWSGSAIPNTDIGLGFGRRNVAMDAITKYGQLTFYGDRIWFMYTQGTLVGWVGIGIDGKVSNITTVGALSGTGTGTFNVGDSWGWPTPGVSFTMTVDNEDMTVSNGTGLNSGLMTITARGINGTTAVAHSTVGTPAMWAPAGVVRYNTYNATPPRISGRVWDSGLLSRGQHTLTVMPINKSGGGGTYSVYVDGAMVFDGDGAGGPATFTDGTPKSTTIGAGSNGVNVNTFVGAQTLTVADTSTAPSSGYLIVTTGSGLALVQYGAIGSSTTFTSCTTLGPFQLSMGQVTVVAGVMSTGGAVITQHYDSATAKFVALDQSNQFRAPNLSGGNMLITSVVSGTRVKLTVPPTATGSGQTFSLGGRGAGVRIWEGGHAGYKSTAFNGPINTTAGYWADGLDSVDPDLLFIEFAVNDINGGVTVPQFITAMESNIDLINTQASVAPSIVIMIPYLYLAFTPAQYQPYVDAMYLIAKNKGCAVFDLNTIILPQVAGDILCDGIHPTDYGSSYIAMELQKFLIGSENTDLPAPVTYDWSLAMKTWRQALGMVAVRPVDVVFVGDSISEGYYASTDDARFFSQIRNRLQITYNPPNVPGGEGYIPMIHTVGGNITAAAPSGFVNLPQRWTYAGSLPEALGSMTTGYTQGYGLGRRGWFYSSGTSVTATISVFCDRFWILYTKFATAASLQISVDGGGATSVSSANAVTQSGYVYDSGPLTLGTHSVKVNASASGGAIPDGIMVFNGDGGDITLTDAQTFTNTRLVSYKAYFQRRDVGKTVTSPGNTPIPAATTIVAYVSPNEVTLSQATLTTASNGTFSILGRGSGLRLWDGSQAGATSAFFAGPAGSAFGLWADALENIDPDLVLIQVGPNDSNPASSIPPSTYQQNLINIVNLIRYKCTPLGAGGGSPSIAFVSNWVSGVVSLQNWQPYRDAMFNVACTMGCAVIDLSMRMGPGPASGNTDLFADPLHLTDEGSFVAANEHLWGLGVSDIRLPNTIDIPEQAVFPGKPQPGYVRLFAKGSGQLWTKNDQDVQQALGIMIGRNSTTQTIGGTTLVNVTGLSLPVLQPGTVYAFEAVLNMNIQNSGNSGGKIALTVPAGATFNATVESNPSAATTRNAYFSAGATAQQSLISSAGYTGLIRISGSLTAGTATSHTGTIQVQAASAGSTATSTSNTATIQAGAWIQAIKLL